MPFLVLLIGAILIIAAWRDTYGDLFTALQTDVPGFFKWALAVVAIGALGYAPGLKPISRMLLALVIVVLVVKNYEKLFAGFSSLASTTPTSTTGATEVATQYAQAAGTTAPTTVATATTTATTAVASNAASGTTGTTAASSTATLNSPTSNPIGAYDPAAYLTAFEKGVGGFGGIV
jgi:hypothetical protein